MDAFLNIIAYGNFSYFLSKSHPVTSYQILSQLAFRFRGKFKIDFQDGGHLGFPIGTNLPYFEWIGFLVTGEEVQNKFSGWQP